jgi:Cysteine rich repeat
MISRLARVLVLPVLLAAGAAGAQQGSPPPGAAHVREACAADIQRLCPDAQSGRGGVRMCLRDHQNDLSDNCRSALSAMRQQPRQGQGQGPDADAPPPPAPDGSPHP